MQNSKQQRRKRGDAQSRDYLCKCGKSYLSYAAVYTHVKKNHSNNSDYFNNIKKPDRAMNRRGRPKNRKQNIISSQNAALSICEQTILSIFNIFEQRPNHNFQQIILQGDQALNQQQVQKQVNIIYEQYFKEKYIVQNCFKQQRLFLQGLTKHFLPYFAAKVIIVVHLLTKFTKEEVIEQVKKINLLHGQDKIVQTIQIGWNRYKHNIKQVNVQEQSCFTH